MVEEPWLFVSGLLHESDCPTLLGSVAFSRATLSKSIWLSEGARPGPKFPAKGMIWACAATGSRTHTASADHKQCRNRSRMYLSFAFSVPLPPRDTGMRQALPPLRVSVAWSNQNQDHGRKRQYGYGQLVVSGVYGGPQGV